MTAIEFNQQLLSLSPNLKKFAYSLTSDYEDAQDLTQETFLKALAYRDKFEDYSNLKAWTFTIMKNTFINNYRRMIKQNTTFDNTKDLYFINQTKESEFLTPESELNFDEINKSIESLENEYKEPFLMHVNGYKYKEIADKLELKIGTVKSRIFFTRKKLMEKLRDFDR